VQQPIVQGLGGVRAEAEWFVSHICERVEAERAARLWGPVLMSGSPLTVATTNYDRAIELAAFRLGVPISDGFPPFEDAELVAWQGFGGSSGPRLLKIHGSTDWYLGAGHGEVWKLRHPMPLYGGVEVTTGSADVRLRSALVLPSREKIINSPPYPALQYELRKAVEFSDFTVLVGSSLRDPDLRDIVTWSAQARPTLVVGRHLPQTPPGAVPVEMSASRFLGSLLPRMLAADSPREAARLAQEDSGRTEPILDDLCVALDPGALSQARCDAIDRLVGWRVVLAREQIANLLRDADFAVATYALGLIPDASNPADLVAVAGERADANGLGYKRELDLLREVVAAQQPKSTGHQT